MKRLLTAVGVLSVSSYVALAAVRIEAGQSWSYQFTSLPLLGPETVLIGGNIDGGAHVTLSNLDPGTHYTFSIYEDRLSEPPIWVTDSALNQSASAGGRGIWKDLQGWAEVQVVSGALTIDEIEFDARIPIDDTHAYHYQSIIATVPPTIQNSPLTQTVEAGSPVDFWLRATGPGPLFYLWYFNNANLLGFSTNYHLQLTNLKFSQSGAYTVVVTNAFGAVTSSPAILNVISAVNRRSVPALSVAGQTGSTQHVEYNDRPGAPSTWQVLDTVILTLPSQYWFDLSSPLAPQRFYRVWQTGAPTALPSFKSISMVPAITVAGNVGDSLRLDYIPAIGPTNGWVTLDTMILTNTSQLYFDVTAPRQPERLYRLVQIP